MPRARAALAAAALLAAALAAALPRSAAAADGQAVDAEVVYAESNRGLVPERFRAYGIIHYAQMVQPPEAAKGTIVSGGACRASGHARSVGGAACLPPLPPSVRRAGHSR